MRKIAICGDFYDRNVTGIQRVAYEMVRELDKITTKGEMVIIVPSNIKNVPKYKNIEVIRIHSDNGNRHFWIQWWFAVYIIKNKMTALTICNELPLLKPGIAYLHDIYYKVHSEVFETYTDKISRMVILLFYKCITQNAKQIITVSETSKKEIVEVYKVNPNRITVIGLGWQHILEIVPDYSIFDKNIDIRKDEYYFSLGNMGKRKNTEWILRYAEIHKGETFVLCGRKPKNSIYLPKNVKYLGYLSDEQIVALYKNCKAFIFPSLYEGFGMPPMEAMAVGAKVIVSNIPVLQEVYENSVYFIDPYSYDMDLEKVLYGGGVGEKDLILNKYSWKKSAEDLYSVLQNIS